MQLQQQQVPYYLKSALDRAIDEFARRQSNLSVQGKSKTPEQLASERRHLLHELNHIKSIAQVQAGLEKYKKEAGCMSERELESEQHCSIRLGEHLRATGKPKPDDRVDAHAIVAGKYPDAVMLRGLMAAYGIRIDDPDNGMWMPRRSADTPHWAFPRCPPHSRIHRFNYYFWLLSILRSQGDEVQLRHSLRMIARHLEYGTYPEYVLNRKGENLPDEGDQ